MRFKNIVDLCSTWVAVLLLGIFILGSTFVRGAEIQGTNPLSRRLQNSKSNSTPPHSESKFMSNATTTREKILMQNILQKLNNVGIVYSNHTSGKITPKSLSKRMGKRRRFRIKQSSPLQPKRESRPYFHDFITKKNGRMTKSRDNIQRKEEQDLNFDKGFQTESLRLKILSQLGAVDPLLCLPKALCGLASNYEEKIRLQSLQGTEPTEISDNEFEYNGNGNKPQPTTATEDEDWVHNYMELMKTFVPKNDDSTGKKRKKQKSKIHDNDLDDSSSKSSEESVEELSDISSPEELLSQDDLNHFKKKARVEKWMKEEDYDPEPNWWDILPQNQPYHALDEIPSQGPHHHEESGASGSWSTLRISKGLSSFFTSMLPQISLGFGKAPDVFADDPWFHDYRKRSFNGRSMTDGSSRSFSWLFGKADGLGEKGVSSNGSGMHRERTGRGDAQKGTKRNKNKIKNKNKKENGKNPRSHSNDGELNMINDDPMEKFQLAVEIGKQMEDPKQCDYVFTGCPFTYLEIIEIIESSKKSELGGNLNKENQLDLGTLGLINNVTSTISHDLPTGDRLEISLKIADKDHGTMVPLSAILQNPDDHPTVLTMTATPSHASELSYRPPTMADNDGPIAEGSNYPNHPRTPAPPLFRTALFDKSETHGVGEDDSLESSFKPPTTQKPLRPAPLPTPIKRRHKPKGKPSRSPPNRKQWGAQHQHGPTHISPVVVQLQPPRPLSPPPPPPTIHRQSQFHTHTKYKHIPMPTTINKPSHVINYHFHNTNTHPQVSHSGNSQHPPQQLTVHSYPKPEPPTPQVPPITSTTATPTTTPMTTTTTTTTPQPPIRFRDDFEPPRRRNRKRRRHYKSPSQKIKKRRRKPKPSRRSSEERIVIRLPKTTQPPNNNYYNLYPLLQPQPQQSPQMYQPQPQSYPPPPPQQYHNNHHQHHSPVSHPSMPHTQPYFVASQPSHHGFQPHPHHHHHQSHPYYPHSPLLTPGIFSYILGKKK